MNKLNLLVHGFRVRNPSKTVGKLAKFIPNSYVFNYGWFGVFSVLFRNKSEAAKLAKLIATTTVANVVGHSNGCAIAVEAARQGANIDTLILVNAALKRDTVFPKSIRHIVVIYTKHDTPTKTARFLDKVPFVQIFVPNAWGAMGAEGPSVADSRITYVHDDNLNGHSAIFDDAVLRTYVRRFNSWLA